MRNFHRAVAAVALAAPLTLGVAGFASATPHPQHAPATDAPTIPVIDLTGLSPLTDILFDGPPVSPEHQSPEQR